MLILASANAYPYKIHFVFTKQSSMQILLFRLFVVDFLKIIPCVVAILIPIGTAIIVVADVKYVRVSISTVNI